jgi:hypothetical protein
MVDVKIDTGTAVFEVIGFDKILTLRNRLEIPIAHIKAAHVDPHPAMGWFQGFRIAGADVPHLLRAGMFYQDGGLVFWDVRHPERTIVVELDHERYEKLVIEVADPAETAALVNAAVSSSKGTFRQSRE